jgi:hypothetical protein
MNNKHRIFRSSLVRLLQTGLTAALAVALLAIPVASNAQEITTVVRGTVLTPDGAPASGVSVSVTDTRTGAVRRVTTGANGGFNVRGLSAGGPYEIRVQSAQYQDALVTDVYTNLSAPANFNIALGAVDAEIEEIVVVASQVATVDMAVGPGTTFSLDDIESVPSIARQVRDVIRADPRVSLGRADNGGGYGINCMGGNSRSNAFTIDGTLVNDGFGLNEGTGTSARFAFPVPYDAVSSVSVEFAPLDVQYGQFKGCAINVVTKPGSNEFFGSAFYLINNEDMTGTKIDGRRVSSDPFEDLNYGFELGGPIVKDKLFFYINYEETDEGGIQNSGPIGGGFANEDWLTVDEANTIGGILSSQYGREGLEIVRTLPQTSERIFARLDWNINDQHRAEFTYTKLEELNLDPDDMGFDGFTFRDNFEFEGVDNETVTARLFSNWTDNFSTEFRYSSFDAIDIQGPAGGGEAQDPIPIPRITVEDGSGDPILTSGPGTFRSANDLQYTVDQIKLAADYVVGDHTLTFGFEQESRDVFNLFIPNATGTIDFDSVADLAAGTASFIDAEGSYTQDPNDAAAAFERAINSFYVQDQWQVNDSLMVIAGVRFDQYDSSDRVLFNPAFEQRYGFSNTQSFDGLDIVQPRIGLTWDMPTSKWGETQLTAGFGVFAGQDPTVHFANSYQNFGGALGRANVFDCADPDAALQVINNGQFTGVPSCIWQAAADAANANAGSVAAVDPNFELPEDHRFHIGLSHHMESDIKFLNDWHIRAEYIYTKHENAPHWVDLTQTPSGVTLPDGRPQYMGIDPLLPGCDATFNGIGQGFSGSEIFPGGACDDESNENQDILMTNGVEGDTSSFALILGKDFAFSDKTSFDMSFGYAYTDSETGNAINSSTAWSNYEEVSVAIPGQVTLAPNLWANKHNITLRGRLQHYFLENHPTTFSFFFNRRSGRPFSYAYEDDTVEEYFGDSDDEARILIYVPTGPSDPLMNFDAFDVANDPDGPAELAALFAFIESSGLGKYAGGIAPRNAFNAPWSSDLDIRIKQPIPLGGDHTLDVFLDIENVLNIFSDNDNIKRYPHTDDVQEAARLLEIQQFGGPVNNFDQFEITRWYNEGHNWNEDVDDSVYRIQLGVQYRFR